jgi:ribosome biogenesis GTPase
MSELREGLVVRTDAKVCHVDVDGRALVAVPRGLLYEPGTRTQQKNPVAAGDRVELDLSSSPASLLRVLPRRNWLGRVASSHDPREQVLFANVDQLLVVASFVHPLFSSNRTDRILAACCRARIPPVLVLNKIDLAEPEERASIVATYRAIPIPVLECCALDGRGLDELRALLRDRVSALYGASGAGKSTLVNALQPGLELKVARISGFWQQGKHTTTAAQLHRLDFGGWVVDTPGIRVFRLFGVPPEELRHLFPDFGPFEGRCRFPDCTHDHEPECAVFAAVEGGRLAASRYASYVELLDELRSASGAAADDD